MCKKTYFRNMKLTRQQTKVISNDLLTLLEKDGFEKFEQTNFEATHSLIQAIYDLLASKTTEQLTTQLNDYDKEEIGDKIISLIEKENFETPILPSQSGFIQENETPEIDNSSKIFHVKLFTDITNIYTNHLKK